MPCQVFGRQGFFQPGQVQPGKSRCTAQGFRTAKALVRIGHDVEARADRGAHRREPRHILADMGPADLDLGAAEAFALGELRVFDQGLGREM